MNTPAHLIFGAAMFAQPNNPKVTAAAIVGSLMPDLSLYLLSAWSIFIDKNDTGYVFGVQYFSTNWQNIYAVDNSFIVWGGILALGLFTARKWLWVFAASGLIHLFFDFLLHNDDARRHFWPLSDWVFVSPFSYWDQDHHGLLVGGMEMAAVFVMTAVLLRRFGFSWMSFVFGLVALAELAPILLFRAMH
jgi:membrane-bound metal-dependent hydrolase YbcI (DUF457 family)